MSYTEIYAVAKDDLVKVGETQNGHRGAMYVWHDIAKRYFGLDSFPMFDEDMMRRVWNAGNEHELPEHELIVLASTMDKVTVKPSDINRLTQAFFKYAEEHPHSSLGEQAEILSDTSFTDDYLIAWNQTSAGEFCFDSTYSDEDEEGCAEIIYHDLSGAWDLFEQVDGGK